jgi:choice-of-anchor C domain-containing protein
MTKKWLISAGSGLAAAVLIASAAVAVETVETNGSFENGVNAPTTGYRGPLGTTNSDITGWTIATGTVDWIGSLWQAADGARSIDLSGSGPGALSQTLTTTVGATYAVEFKLSGNPDGSPLLKTLNVVATGGAPQAFTYDRGATSNTRLDMKWADQLYTFVANSTSTTLTFTSTTSSAYGPALDDVAITETLAKAADCKKEGWKTMFDSSLNTFKNQGDCVSFFATDGRNAGDGS